MGIVCAPLRGCLTRSIFTTPGLVEVGGHLRHLPAASSADAHARRGTHTQQRRNRDTRQLAREKTVACRKREGRGREGRKEGEGGDVVECEGGNDFAVEWGFSRTRLPPVVLVPWQLRKDLLGMVVCLKDLYLESGVVVRPNPTLTPKASSSHLSTSRMHLPSRSTRALTLSCGRRC